MQHLYDDFTIYVGKEEKEIGNYPITSNICDKMVFVIPDQKPVIAEIKFNGKEPDGFLDNPIIVTMRKTEPVTETWRFYAQRLSFGVDNIKMSITKIEYYVDGEEKLFWDPLNYIHRILGKDLMAETRKNIGMV